MNRYLPWLLGLAFGWGLFEATIFFIVPDVIISLIALKYGFRQGLNACVASAIGAGLGGIVIYAWGANDISSARNFFELLPAIAPSTIARASSEIADHAFGVSMLRGSMTGVPFKLYASEAGAAGTSLLTFIALTPLVRMPRFLIAATGAAIARRWAPALFQKHILKLFVLFWIGFYALYWIAAPS